MNVEIQTKRLLLRNWIENDRSQFTDINNDSEVMRYFPRKFTQTESDAFVDDNRTRLAELGWGAWAVELTSSREFIGYVGFSYPAQWHPCAGMIEIGWRLGRNAWGQGYATEAAKQLLHIGFESVGFEEIVSFTSECNSPSISVMRKIGMSDDGIGFEHPRIEKNSPLRKHVLYRLTKSEWRAKRA